MKQIPIFLFFLLPLLLFAQTEKGASPIPNTHPEVSSGQTYAVVIGISDYQDAAILDLRFAHKDAQAFANFLRSPAGGSLDEDHLKLLTNEQATGAQIIMSLDWLIDEVEEGDRVIIYFSGHGDVESKRISQPGYLLGWDAPSRVYAAGGAMNIRDLQDYISTLSVYNKAKVVIITDACRSGKLSGSAIDGAQLTNKNLAIQYENETKILSCQPNEYSIEGEQWGGGRGAFSYHLIDGLYGMADGNADLFVNLMEIGRYLQDKVTTEVAPQSQVPMTVGNFTQNLVQVYPDLLKQVQGGKRVQLQLFTSAESRGIEESVLTAADSNMVVLYNAFKEAVREKRFLKPEKNCADYYYEILSKEPQIEKLHASMRRNYAAALQDEAQHFLNTLINTGLTADITHGVSLKDLYKKHPALLERAAEILGKQHYMYDILQARKYYFTNRLLPVEERIPVLKKALDFQPDMAHAMVEIVWNAKAEYADSAQYYARQAMELVPSWVEPYIALAMFNARQLEDYERAEQLLNMAGEIAPSSILVWLFKGNFYFENKKDYALAEKWYLKILNSSDSSLSTELCFPCMHLRLGVIYRNTNRLKEAEALYVRRVQLDSTNARSLNILGWFYLTTNQYEKAEPTFLKAMALDPQYIHAPANLGLLYTKMGRYDEAIELFEKGLELAPDNLDILVSYAVFYSLQNQPDKAYENLEEALSKGYDGSDHILIQDDPDLSLLRKQKERWEKMMKQYFPERTR